MGADTVLTADQAARAVDAGASFVHGLTNGHTLPRALAYGTAHGALVMTTPGDTPPWPH